MSMYVKQVLSQWTHVYCRGLKCKVIKFDGTNFTLDNGMAVFTAHYTEVSPN